jgi:hypothetical protein
MQIFNRRVPFYYSATLYPLHTLTTPLVLPGVLPHRELLVLVLAQVNITASLGKAVRIRFGRRAASTFTYLVDWEHECLFDYWATVLVRCYPILYPFTALC